MSLETLILICLPAALCVMASGLLRLGYVGQQVDAHPLCRRCGFDLVGKPPGKRGGICSECGADLGRPRAVRVGNRQRRPRLLMAGATLMVPAVASVALVGWAQWVRSHGAAGNAHKPSWWLAREADASQAATRDAALAELSRRLAAGELSNARLLDVVDRGLRRQADARRPWTTAWGDFIEAARAAGRVPDETWQRYARQAVEMSYTIEPELTVRRGQPLGVIVTITPARVAAKSVLHVEYDDATLNGQSAGSRTFRTASLSSWTGQVRVVLVKPERFADLPDGHHVVRQTFTVFEPLPGDKRKTVVPSIEIEAPVYLRTETAVPPTTQGAQEQ